MGKYNTVRSEMWSDKEFYKLSHEDKLFFNYILSCPVGNMAGYFKLPIQQIKIDLCRYDKETDEYNKDDMDGFRKKILPSLKCESKLWKYDYETEQILIPSYLKYNKVGGEKQMTAINKSILTLTFCDLHIDFLYAIKKYVSPESVRYLDSGLVADIYVRAEELLSKSEEAQTLLNTK